MKDFRRAADDVRNWGRWGDDDEIGTLNFITAEKVAEAAGCVKKGSVISLGGDFGSSGPQGAFKFRQNPVHVMTVDGGDANTLCQYAPDWLRNSVAQELSSFFVDNIFRFNDDMIVMPLQAATQWDALSRQGRHLPRRAARRGGAPRRGRVLSTWKPDYPSRTR
jgi:hypothetical protein